MLLKVKPLNSDIITIEIDESNLVEELECRISSLTGVSSEEYRLVYRGKILKKESVISSYDINGPIFMVKSSKSKESKNENDSKFHSSSTTTHFPLPPQTIPTEIPPPQPSSSIEINHFPIPPSSSSQSSSIPTSFRDSLSSTINTLNQSQRNITNINSRSQTNNNHLSLQLQQQRLILGEIFNRMSGIYTNSLSPLTITSNTLLNNNIPSDAVRNLKNILNDINSVNKICCEMINEYLNLNNEMNNEREVTRIENNNQSSSSPSLPPQQQQQRFNNNNNNGNDLMNNLVEVGSNVARNIIGPLLGTGTNNIFHSVLQSINNTIFDISRMNNNNNNSVSNNGNENAVEHNEEID